MFAPDVPDTLATPPSDVVLSAVWPFSLLFFTPADAAADDVIQRKDRMNLIWIVSVASVSC